MYKSEPASGLRRFLSGISHSPASILKKLASESGIQWWYFYEDRSGFEADRLEVHFQVEGTPETLLKFKEALGQLDAQQTT